MGFDPHIAAIRFGTGLSPQIAPPDSASAMLAALKGPDHAAMQAPIVGFDEHLAVSARNWQAQRSLQAARRQGDAAADRAIKEIRRQRMGIINASLKATLIRGMVTADGFRERLTAFWADHFATRAATGPIQSGVGAYVESALRPHLAGRFSDLLISAVTHPVMVHYLDQTRSMGPNSVAARRGNSDTGGLNENLAREVLELHTLGVDGPYSQTDVRELAELFTGLTFSLQKGREFRPAMSEPGSEVVLGRSYGHGQPGFDDIRAVLVDLARHPATAAHIAGKLARHFVADDPEPALVAALRDAFIDSEGDLMAVYAALLGHPAAWHGDRRNVKPPLLYMTSALRALGTPREAILDLPRRKVRVLLNHPMRNMGHRWQSPTGPDGLPEADAAWISPPSLAARVQWALAVPERLAPLPDPRQFVKDALGDRAPEAVRFAASAAESRREGVGLVLMSPAFQRM